MKKIYTHQQFMADFPTEAACVKKIFELKFKGNCSVCREPHQNFVRVKGQRAMRCPKCYLKIFVCNDSVFQNSTTELRSWFLVLYMLSVSKHSVPATDIVRSTGVTYKTASRMLKKIFRQLGKDMEGTQLKDRVEVDEIYIGKAKKRGRYIGKRVVAFGAVQRGGKVLLHQVQDAKSENLFPRIDEAIPDKDNTILYSDELKSYDGVKKKLGISNHRRIKHNDKVYAIKDVSTNTIEGVNAQIRYAMRTHRYISQQYGQLYLYYVAFLHNNRNSFMFDSMLKIMIQ